ncbi:MAG: M20/M25/M40 family metallo-hydrolase [Candidatus Dojkabacteria bacterium]|nr:M20/M25/M40 family metallo-hydrolase [Candidatus Dojkabacteria bacterium]
MFSKKFIDLLSELVSFKSISTDIAYKKELEYTANYIVKLFEDNNFYTRVINYENSNPVIYAEFTVDPKFQTILFYGHYDVQPAKISDGWSSDPFKLRITEDKIYGRGVTDNKGQFLIYVYTVFQLISEGKLKYNVKFFIEGNEETGSNNIENIILKNKDLLKADFVLFSDGELTMQHPTIDAGYRGIINIILQLKTSSKDNHSGLYGGSIPNAITVLVKLLSKLYDLNYHVNISGISNNILKFNIDGFYTDIADIPFDLDVLKKNTGVKDILYKDHNFYYVTGLFTSVEITSITGGYQGEGFRNAIPGYAEAKLNVRISPFHSVDKVLNAIKDTLYSSLPPFAELHLIVHEPVSPVNLNFSSSVVPEIKSYLEKVYEKKVFFKYCGAIVPISGILQRVLNIDVVSIGLGNEDANMHGIDENFDTILIKKGLEFARKFLSKS